MPKLLCQMKGRAGDILESIEMGSTFITCAVCFKQARRVAVVRQRLKPADVVGICEGLPAVPAEPRVLLLYAHCAGPFAHEFI